MTRVLPIFLILISFMLSSAVLPRFNIGAMFDIGLILTICFGLVKGEIKGAVYGFFIGLVYGILMAYMVGLFVFLGFVIGYASGLFKEEYSERSLIITILIVLGMVFAYQLAIYFGQAMLLGQFGFLQRLHTIVFPKTILTTMLFVPIYLFVCLVKSKVKRADLV